MKSKPRTRYAPSPTGLQHVGGIRTALYNWLYAQHTQGTFVLRLEDTDQNRYQPEAAQDIVDSLNWVGIGWQEGYTKGGSHAPYQQSQRLSLYTQYAHTLVERGAAYWAYDYAEELEELRVAGRGYDGRAAHRSKAEKEQMAAQGIVPVLRFRTPTTGKVGHTDLVLGEIWHNCSDVVVDPVLMKADGYPTYHLANVVDDNSMEITHVLRAQEWLSSTPLHLLIYKAFAWTPPLFGHLPPIVGPDGKKLSKRYGATSIRTLRNDGYSPEALVNYIALLGWAYDDKRENFTLPELVKAFSIAGIQRSPAQFDEKKLLWHNKIHIRSLDTQKFIAILLTEFKNTESPLSTKRIEQIRCAAPFIQSRINRPSEAPQWLAFCKEGTQISYKDFTIAKKTTPQEVVSILNTLVNVFTASTFQDTTEPFPQLAAIAKQHNYHVGLFMNILRYALTGSTISLPMEALFMLLSIEERCTRIGKMIQYMHNNYN